jgi:hypothetical protein
MSDSFATALLRHLPIAYSALFAATFCFKALTWNSGAFVLHTYLVASPLRPTSTPLIEILHQFVIISLGCSNLS